MSHRAVILALLACALPWVSVASAAGERTAVYPGTPGPEIASHILFEAVFPLNELLSSKWTPSQQREVHYILERMKKDNRIFILVHAVLDPIGGEAENGSLALSVSRAVSERLRESGIRQDRILILPGKEDAQLFSQPRWDGFEGRQKIILRAVQGGVWLSERRAAVTVSEELPPEGSIRILAPAGDRTEISRHLLSGTAGEGVRTVSISIGRETKTAAVYEGKFTVPISLQPGENRIVVTGLDPYGRALRASRRILYDRPSPTIVIASPPKDAIADVTRSPVVTVSGRIDSRVPLRGAYLIQNDIPLHIRIREDGTFEQQAALVTDEDVFVVEAEDGEGRSGVSERRKVAAHGIAERPLMAILHWDEDDVDLDLHVTDESGRHTWFDAPSVFEDAGSIPEGKLLLDNRSGFGPEVFTVDTEAKGRFTFSVDYYRGKKACRAYLAVVLFAGSPSRKMVTVFGPVVVSPSRRNAELVQVDLPAGTMVEGRR